jgi:hypothetical protein
MAWETKRLATETLEARRQADREHQESLMPLLKFATAPAMVGVGFVFRAGLIKNTGTGPALKIAIIYSSSFGDDITYYVPALGIGEEWHVPEQGWPVKGPTPANAVWTLTIAYQNLFGAIAQTVTQHNDVAAPLFVAPTVVARTLPKR